MRHKHAALMALYAKDSEETETPWLRWQMKSPGNEVWKDYPEDCFGIAWNPETEYRRKCIQERD